ncbi:MAG: flagellar hook-basal body protein [Chloroflexi bacterium]|nr:MAG: flagellar hook-basal body protein [Chloroflexota bacterium]MBL1194824.1 flagellar hook-basal body protein [Chloroflexota bacterium]NOH12115.1 flagellar hook-basal body protein [Chloroflexota bacterium]
MIKGFYAAASAMLANLTRQEHLSHNIANIDTPGFKQVMTSMDDFVETGIYYPQPGNINHSYLGNLGLGVESSPAITDFSEAGLQHTGQPLDLAINGNGFFQVETDNGTRYTRDGRFSRDAEGQLVTVDGYLVLDNNEAPITIDPGLIAVGPDGSISVNGVQAGQIGIAGFEDPAVELTAAEGNLFEATGGATSIEVGSMQQGFLEGSNADPARLTTQMVQVARAYEAAQRLVQSQDELLGRAISTLGRF